MTLAKTRGEVETATLEYNGASLTFNYRKNALSYREWKALRGKIAAARRDPDDPENDWIVPALLPMLVSWDLCADEKNPKALPIDAEVLEALPPAFLLEILGKIWAETVPNPEPATGSGSFS